MRPKQEETQTIDGKEYSVKVIPTFFTDAEGATTTAMDWGTVTLNEHGHQVSCWGGRRPGLKTIEPKTVTIKNKPFTNIRLWTIDSREEGGRAYKFIDEKGRFFDLREDTFLEAVYNDEIRNVNGMVVLTGQYIWVRAHSQMRVARVGSLIHEGLLEAKRRKAMKPITGKQQKIGSVYRKTDGNMYVYVGRDRQRGKLYWSYVQLREPYQGFNEAQIAIHEKWEAMTLQEKFDYEVETRKISGCAETRSTAMVVIEHVADIDMRGGTAQTLQWHPTQIIKGKVVRV
jgi:hypothetical protein